MKIAIQGHPTRGKEVIQILESLGGINAIGYKGCEKDWWYSIYPDDNCILYDNNKEDLCEFKLYTLEEFEKEFPFKVGDIILAKATNNPHEIVALEWFNNKLCYKLDSGLHYAPKALTTYKEMKEERNITLTLDKAKEWYNKGGELKEIALQAFSEKELTKVDLPKTWEEFCDKYSKINDKEYFINADSNIEQVNDVIPNHCRLMNSDRNICPSKKSAEAHLAMIQLEQLRDCWRQGWEPIWDCSEKWCIRLWGNELTIGTTKNISRFLTFPTKEMAEEFLKCFRDLIEKAGDLI